MCVGMVLHPWVCSGCHGNVFLYTELKGNNANGIFGFASNLPTNISEPGNLSLTVTGQGGTFETVTLTWMIAVPAVQGVPVIYDFVANTSQVVFPPGVTQATLTISTFHDGIPPSHGPRVCGIQRRIGQLYSHERS